MIRLEQERQIQLYGPDERDQAARSGEAGPAGGRAAAGAGQLAGAGGGLHGNTFTDTL